MGIKKSFMDKAMAAAKKVMAKPAAKKVMAKPAAKKVMAKPGQQQLKKFQTYTLKSNEKYMNKSQREHFMRILNVWKN